MKGTLPDQRQSQFLMLGLKEMLNPKEGLYQLTEAIPWEEFEKEFEKYYVNFGRPAKPIRLMVALHLLKHLYNKGDETVVAEWPQQPYWQYFSGEKEFQWKLPVEPSDMVHFRKRIGKAGVEKILQMSARLHGKRAEEKEVVIDTTTQEKNITFPTDAKLYRRIAEHCVKIARKEGIPLRQSYKRVVKQCVMAQRLRKHPRYGKEAVKATRKLKTIAGRLVREIERKMAKSAHLEYAKRLEIYHKVLEQRREDKNKIYSLHEPDVYCLSKGKEHKRYEFGSKVSLVVTKQSGIIVGALNFKQNKYDGHTLPEVLQQVNRVVGKDPEAATVDRGYRGVSKVGVTTIHIPNRGKLKMSKYEKEKARRRFRRRAAIEPKIGHLKSDNRLGRNYLHGVFGDQVNVMLAAAANNLRKWILLRRRNIFVLLKNLFIDLGEALSSRFGLEMATVKTLNTF